MRAVRKLGPTRKSFSQPPLWDPKHPLQALWGPSTRPDAEAIENDFEAYVAGAFKANGPVFACVAARQIVFSEATFKFRKRADDANNGAPGGLEDSDALSILHNPWTGGYTGDLLARMEQDASLAGNSYWTKRGSRLVRLRPDWVEIVIGVKDRPDASPLDIDAELVGYWYRPKSTGGGVGSGEVPDPVFLLPHKVAHYAPMPDPIAKYRGMSWITACAKEVEADLLATKHKKAFYDNAAVPNIAVKFDRETSEDAFDEFVEQYNANHKGAWNAYKTLFLMGGADVTPLTMDFHQLEFNQTVGKGESRIAAVAGVPSSWVGFSEGMQGSALNAGNFSAARRRFADGTMRPLWRMASESLSPLVEIPDGYQLWYDDRDIAFLREDQKDRASIFQTQLIAIEAGMRGGFDPDSVVKAAISYDLRPLLGKHTGLTSVQMMATDQEGQRGQEEATTREIEARAIAALSMQGYEIGSIAAFMASGDVAKLKKDPNSLNAAQREQALGIAEQAEGIRVASEGQAVASEAQAEAARAQAHMSEASAAAIRRGQTAQGQQQQSGGGGDKPKPTSSGGGNANQNTDKR